MKRGYFWVFVQYDSCGLTEDIGALGGGYENYLFMYCGNRGERPYFSCKLIFMMKFWREKCGKIFQTDSKNVYI